MAEIICPQCQVPNRSNARFCHECGALLPVSGPRPADADTPAGVLEGSGTGPVSNPPTPVEVLPSTAEQAASAIPSGINIGSDQVVSGSRTVPPLVTPSTDRQTRPVDVDSGRSELQGRYRIEKELGRGGFGAVYKAWDANLNHFCALKENMDASPEAARQFQREASVLANLTHPNLPRVTDHFIIPGQGQYLVMDFVEGEDLASVAQRQRQTPFRETLDWIVQVANALVYLHSRQPPVLHRDIKPANIRITPEGQAMLVDFGLVKMYDPSMKTTMGARAVTPGYAPPEQYGLGRTDVRSDIYALAATMYRMLTGVEPMESVQRAAGGQMAPANELNREVPAGVSQALDRAMSLDPRQRFQTAAEFKQALLAGAGLAPMVSYPAEPVYVAPAQPIPAVAPTAAVSEPAIRQRGVAQTVAMPEAVIPPSAQPAARPVSKPVKRGGSKIWLVVGGVGLFALICIASIFLLSMFPDDGEDMDATQTALALEIQGLASSTPGKAATSPVELEPTDTPPAVVIVTPTPNPSFRSKNPETYIYLDSGQPDTLDPALNYETSGLTVIQNLYDTLIFFDRESPDVFVPQLALEVPSLDNGGISPDGLTYTFKIRPGVQFHDGSVMTADDVAYSFQRGILQGGLESPQWLLTEPLLGIGIYDISGLVDPALTDNRDGMLKDNPDAMMKACLQVTGAIVADNAAGTVTFHLKQPWGPFIATLANGWGGVRSKAWTIANGGWDGNCARWQNYYAIPASELNKGKLGSGAMGTGPYMLDHWTVDKELVLKANPNYWRTEPAWPGGPIGAPRLKTIEVRFVWEIDDHIKLLESGEGDSTNQETSTFWSRLDPHTGLTCNRTDLDCTPMNTPLARLERVTGLALGGRNNDVLFNWHINTDGGNKLIGSGALDGNGIPADFFSNVHVRRAFAYCFNYDSFLKEVMQGEGIRAINVMLPNMIGYEANSSYYTYNPEQCAAELHSANINGKSVWDTGFTMQAPAVNSSIARMTISKILGDEFGKLDPRFKIVVSEIESGEYNDLRNAHKLPFTTSGWVEDIHDPHNWTYPFTLGNLGRWQSMDTEFLDQARDNISRAVAQTDPQMRTQIYHEFNKLYYEQVPAILLFQSLGRHYQQRWVNGWYGNPVFPGPYFYVLWKD